MAIDFFKVVFGLDDKYLLIATLFSAAVILISFVLCFILCLVKSGYGFRRRIWFLFASLSVNIFQLGVCLYAKNFITVILIASLATFCFSVVLFLPIRGISVDKSHKKFINFLDSNIKSSAEIPPMEVEKEQTERLHIPLGLTPKKSVFDEEIEDREAGRKKISDIDFSHVKKIISRIKELELSPADKRQISELEKNVSQAEFGEYSPEIKSKINMGLGAVLKIMSKYGA